MIPERRMILEPKILFEISLTILTLGIALIWLSPLYPRLKTFWKRASESLSRLYEIQDTLRIGGKEIKAGRIKEGDKGFRMVRLAILMNRPEVPECEKERGRINEIGLVKEIEGTPFQIAFQEIIPANVAYLGFEGGGFAPFLPNERGERDISSWTARIAERYIGFVIIALMVIWTTLSLLIIWT